MNCWKCGKENPEGARFCNYCGAPLEPTAYPSSAEPKTDVGKALRVLYVKYGAEKVLTDPILLANGLGDLLQDSKKLKGRLKLAMELGIGREFLMQLRSAEEPDKIFESKVLKKLADDVGFKESVSYELMGYLYDMVGWENSGTSPAPGPEPTGNKTGIQEKQPGYLTTKSARSRFLLFFLFIGIETFLVILLWNNRFEFSTPLLYLPMILCGALCGPAYAASGALIAALGNWGNFGWRMDIWVIATVVLAFIELGSCGIVAGFLYRLRLVGNMKPVYVPVISTIAGIVAYSIIGLIFYGNILFKRLFGYDTLLGIILLFVVMPVVFLMLIGVIERNRKTEKLQCGKGKLA